MTRRDQRIAELMHHRNRIDAQLANLGYFPAPDVIPVVQDWKASAQQILEVLRAAPDVHHVEHWANNTPAQQAARRRELERATAKKVS